MPSCSPRATSWSPSRGPGSLAEAFHLRVPVVVTRNVHTIPQERFNTELRRASAALGLVVSSWREIPGAVARLAREPARRQAMRASLDALPPNRAVYEVLDVLAREPHAHHHDTDCLSVV